MNKTLASVPGAAKTKTHPTMSSHVIPAMTVVTRKTDSNNCRENMQKSEPSASGDAKWHICLGKHFGRFSET